MKKTSRKLLCVLTAAIMLFASFGFVNALEASQPAGETTAKAATSSVLINDTRVNFTAYNINGFNYFKLRDLAMALNGSEKQFAVAYDSVNNAVVITTNEAYTPTGGELAVSGSAASATALPTAANITFDGAALEMTVYLIGGNNFFKLRDLASAIDFSVTYDSATATVSVDTAAGYAAGGGAPPSGVPGSAPGGMPGIGNADVETGTGAYVLKDGETLTGGTYISTNADENAIRAEGSIAAALEGVTVKKTAGTASSSDASSFYGLNAAILALDGAVLDITGGTVTATPEGANGIFAYDGATITATDTVVNVTGGNAGGIEVAGGGILYANDLTVTAAGKAAIRSDRGGGTLTVSGGTYTTTGSSGAPAIYSTADIRVSGAVLTANDSEAVVVEGLNSVVLTDCSVTGNMSATYGSSSSENIHNVMLYQSMSGDAETGTSSFTMTGGTLKALSGDMFYITNTSSLINLSDVSLTLADGTNLLTVAGNDGSRGWGTTGENGGTCVFTLAGQTASGEITVDDCSQLDLKITKSSTYTGAINSDGVEAASLSVTLDSTSTWTLTADSYIESFSGSMDDVVTNGHTLYVNGKAMN